MYTKRRNFKKFLQKSQSKKGNPTHLFRLAFLFNNINMKWNPQKQTIRAIESLNRIKAFKAFRSSSSAYISRNDIRNLILKQNKSICYVCNIKIANQIDHVKSVYKCFNENDFEYCNSLENLMPICSSCNQSKKP